ncbi:MAG: CBS domain-containing protein [Anaerolineaceae bacterium]|nr:CBS domain-containing protein [Anaerolineaceae bacterium]
MEYFPYLAVALLAADVLLSTFSSALRTYSTTRLEEQLSAAHRQGALELFLDREDSLVLTTALWRLAARTALVVLVTLRLTTLGGGVAQVVIGAGAAALALLVLAVAVPAACARYNSEWFIVRMMPLMYVLRAITQPLLGALRLVDVLVRRLSGVSQSSDAKDDLEDELLSIVKEGELEGTIEEEEKEMIESIFEFKDTDVAAIMTPRTDMACLARQATLAEARDFVAAEGHSRVPVYEENLDVIVGLLYAKDLLRASGTEGFDQRRVGEIMREVLFIPETKNLSDLLHEFQSAGVHLAIVLDEYGGTAGLVTIEDIIEEIFGEIIDEYDQSEPEEISRVSETAAEVDARTRINDVNDELNITVPEDEDYDTIGGFVLSQLGHIPKAGEQFEYNGLLITILEADQRKIGRLKITQLDQYDESDQD